MSTDQTVPLDPPSAPPEHVAPVPTSEPAASVPSVEPAASVPSVEPAASVPSVEPAASVPSVEELLGPRIRWAGIVWGAVFAALAITGLLTIGEESSRAGIHDWLLAFDPATINPGFVIGVVAVVVGVVLLIAGGLALLRHARRRGAAS
jgi:hypothetical protein